MKTFSITDEYNVVLTNTPIVLFAFRSVFGRFYFLHAAVAFFSLFKNTSETALLQIINAIFSLSVFRTSIGPNTIRTARTLPVHYTKRTLVP